VSSAIEQERKEWQESWDSLLAFASQGPFSKEILKAKEIFFSKLGRAHEISENLYEIASHSFLEWYLFHYTTKAFNKTPAITYITMALDSEVHLQCIGRSIFHHWSLFEVLSVGKSEILLQDLLFSRKRRLFFDPSWPEYQVWKVKEGQVIQARLFYYSSQPASFLTHFWLHPHSERELLKKICQSRSKLWTLHEDFLLSSFETAVRTHELEGQLKVSRASNWNYRELMKKYA